MSGITSIEWSDRVWNPITGCTRVSDGCDFCYAFTLHDRRHEAYQRFDGMYPNGTRMPEQYAKPFSEVQLIPQRLEDPLKIKRPQRFFVNSMSDLFHKDVPDEFITQVFETMNKASHHIFQVLTKRPSRAALIANELTWTPNIWLGTSVESQDYTWRLDKLCHVPAKVRFVSAEPLLGPLDLRKWLKWCPYCEWPHGEQQDCGYCETYPEVRGLDWIIAGAESGHGARQMDEDWVRSLKNQCVESGRSFFYKQNALNGRKIPTPELDGQRWMQFPVAMEA